MTSRPPRKNRQSIESEISFKCLQVNLNRCITAQDLLIQRIKEEGTDIVIGQEPNKARSKNFFCDIHCDSFIYTNIQENILKCVHGDGFVIVEYSCVVLVSSYFSPNREIVYFETLLHELEGQLRRFKKPVVLGADWNAKSPAIGSSTRNAKGNLLEDWMTANNMIVCNQGETPTCSRGQGSVIDFTARSEDSLLFIQGWRVDVETENFSDHYTIQFNINLKKK